MGQRECMPVKVPALLAVNHYLIPCITSGLLITARSKTMSNVVPHRSLQSLLTETQLFIYDRNLIKGTGKSWDHIFRSIKAQKPTIAQRG